MKKILFILLFATTILSPIRGAGGISLVDLGQVQYMRPCKAVFHLKNNSRKSMTITKVDTGCGCTVADYPERSIAGGADYDINVTYDARLMGHFDKMIEVWTSNSNESEILELRGVVVAEVKDFVGDFPFELGSLKADCNYVEFDDVHKGEVVQERFHIYNPTGARVTPQIMHLPDYLTAEVSPSTVKAASSAEVTLTLNSARIKDYGLYQSQIYLGANPGEKVAKNKEIGLALVILPDVTALSGSKTAPQIVLSATKLDMPIADGKKKSETIEMQNVGKATLEIQNLQMFSEGMEISLNKRSIAPGEMAKLKVTVIPQKMQNLRTVPRIMMITNDPATPKVVITVNIK